MKRKNIIFFILLFVLLIFIYNDSNYDYYNGDELIYVRNILNEKDFNEVLRLNRDKTTFKNEDYRYIKPLKDQNINDIFYSDKYINKLKDLLQNEGIFESDFPIEHRIYPVGSQGMKWHRDTLMYDLPQYEGVFTIRNQSDSETQWIDEKNKKNSIWTEPNSFLIVKAHGFNHHVTPVLKGEREILKMIYTQSNQTNDNYLREMKRFNSLNI